MKLLLTILLIAIPTLAQAPAPKLTPEQDKNIKAAVAQVQQASKEFTDAQMKLQSAQSQLSSTVYQAMAELQLKPSEWNPAISADGTLTFQPVQKAQNKPPEKKP